MKKILYTLMAACVLFACKPQEQEVKPEPQGPSQVFEVEDPGTLSPDPQTLSVNVKTSVEFDVVMPKDTPWVTYLDTKAEAPAVSIKVVRFSLTLNEEDKMRQARVVFNDKEGKQLGTLAIMQKAGGGIEITVETPEVYPVEGGSFTLAVTSNVPFAVKAFASSEENAEEVTWVVPTAQAEAVALEIEPNDQISQRSAELRFYREGTENLIAVQTIIQAEPHVILNDAAYADLASALADYALMTAGPAVLTLDASVHKGDIIADETMVPLTIYGEGATLDGTIEIKNLPVTIEGLTIAPSEEGVLPAYETDFKYQHGIMLHGAGYGVTLSGVTIDMSHLAADATGIFLLSESVGAGHDIIRGVTVDGGASGHRLMQIYGGRVSLTGSTFRGPYSSYAVRVGNKDNDVILASNTFEGTSACGVHFNNLENSNITLGNGARDNNKFAETIELPYKANSDVTAAGNTFAPAVEYAGGAVNPIIDPEAMASLTRVWGYYNGRTGAWDDAITSQSNWNRNVAITGGYVYVNISGNEDGKYGIAVFNMKDGSYVRTITDGFEKEGRFYTSGIAKLPLADGSGDVIYVSNMAIGNDESPQKLMIYKLVEFDSEGIPTKAEVALNGYEVPAGKRFGDKMTSYGTDADGLLMFTSYTKEGASRAFIEFKVDEGVINPEIHLTGGPLFCTGNNDCGAGMYVITSQTTGAGSTRQALYGSSNDFRFDVGWWYENPDFWYNVSTKETGEDGSEIYSILSGAGNYDANALDPRLFYIAGYPYLAYVTIELDAQSHSAGWLRLVRVGYRNSTFNSGYPWLDNLWAARNDDSSFQRYAIGDSDDYYAVGHESTNKTGYCDVYQDELGDIYIVAGITSTGMSLFKVDL